MIILRVVCYFPSLLLPPGLHCLAASSYCWVSMPAPATIGHCDTILSDIMEPAQHLCGAMRCGWRRFQGDTDDARLHTLPKLSCLWTYAWTPFPPIISYLYLVILLWLFSRNYQHIHVGCEVKRGLEILALIQDITPETVRN